MSQKKKVRLADIAEKLNISVVSVSKAMAGKEGVGDELREQILAMAAQMGYVTKKMKNSTCQDGPNEIGLGGSVTGNIGIVIPSRFFSPNYSYYWYLFNHLSTELLKHNYFSIMELISDKDEEEQNLPRMITDKKVDGIIILGQVSGDYLEKFRANYSNFILLDFYTNDPKLDTVSNDDFYCSYIMTNYVISMGHRSLRFVGNFDATTSIRDRYMGFEKALLENKIDVCVDDILDDRDSMGNLSPIPLPPRSKMPTAFICNNDETAANLILQLIDEGYRVPEDISVTGFDNFIPRAQPPVGLTTCFIRPEDTARIASNLIISKITGADYIHGRHLVSGSIVIRDSVSFAKHE